MKKVYIQFTDDGQIILDRFDGNQRFALYIGIDQLYGSWLLETNGDPNTLVSLEDEQGEDCDARIETIRDIISDPATPWEPCDEDDESYVAEWLGIWGCI